MGQAPICRHGIHCREIACVNGSRGSLFITTKVEILKATAVSNHTKQALQQPETLVVPVQNVKHQLQEVLKCAPKGFCDEPGNRQLIEEITAVLRGAGLVLQKAHVQRINEGLAVAVGPLMSLSDAVADEVLRSALQQSRRAFQSLIDRIWDSKRNEHAPTCISLQFEQISTMQEHGQFKERVGKDLADIRMFMCSLPRLLFYSRKVVADKAPLSDVDDLQGSLVFLA